VNLPPLFVHLLFTPVEQVDTTKFLVVCINDTLTWREHVRLVSFTMSMNLNLLWCLSWFLPKSSLLLFYHSYICLLLIIVMWCGGAAQKTRQHRWNGCRTLQLEPFFTRATGIQRPLPGESLASQPCLQGVTFTWPNTHIKLSVASILHTCRAFSLWPHDQPLWLLYQTGFYGQCPSSPASRTKFGKTAFSYRGAAIWNSLPTNIRIASTISAFNFIIHPYLLST